MAGNEVSIRRHEYVCWLCVEDIEDAICALNEARNEDYEAVCCAFLSASSFIIHLREFHGVK